MAPAATDFRQHLEIETPEHVVLDYEIAGIGSRALAAIVDAVILTGWALLLGLGFSLLSLGDVPWASAIVMLLWFTSMWGYFTFFEGLRQGQTPGKRYIGIRVVRDTGHAVTLGAAAARNLLRPADFLPAGYFLGALLVALHPRAKRLGDLVAGTVVVRDRPMEREAAETGASQLAGTGGDEAAAPELSDQEFRLLLEFHERSPSLDPQVRRRLADRMAPRFAERYSVRPASNVAFLTQLYGRELERRRGRFGAAAVRSGPDRRSVAAADRMAARKVERWGQFQSLADRASRAGLNSFSARELPDFAARYREVAADLARARTYGAEPRLLVRLERLAAAGHNALYRDERHTSRRVWDEVTRRFPAAVIRSKGTVCIAMLTFLLPAGAGFMLIRERPALAQELLPDGMLRRAEAGAERIKSGKGYLEIEARVRPMVASTIITNNIRVAFTCFAGGIFLGVGSLVLLGYNGLTLGTISAHYANVGLLGYLWTFVIGHGVLELFAIWVAGAAGFLLGRAVLAPGDQTRSEALVESGRRALRMVGASVVLLLVAGTIEGFLSASEEGLAYRLGVSLSSAVFLVLYLLNGAKYRESG